MSRTDHHVRGTAKHDRDDKRDWLRYNGRPYNRRHVNADTRATINDELNPSVTTDRRPGLKKLRRTPVWSTLSSSIWDMIAEANLTHDTALLHREWTPRTVKVTRPAAPVRVKAVQRRAPRIDYALVNMARNNRALYIPENPSLMQLARRGR